MTNIIFLDFDGPLIPLRCHINTRRQEWKEALAQHHLDDRTGYGFMDIVALDMLFELERINKNIRYVISSSWAEIYTTKDEITKLFLINGFNLKMHDDWITPREENIFTRSDQIQGWLNKHPEIENYLILDDNASGSGDFSNLQNVFLVSDDNGILWKDFCKIKDVVGSWHKPNLKRVNSFKL